MACNLHWHAFISRRYIPSELGYGDSGSPPKIKGGDPLVFQMEIMKIKVGGGVQFSFLVVLSSAPGLLVLGSALRPSHSCFRCCRRATRSPPSSATRPRARRTLAASATRRPDAQPLRRLQLTPLQRQGARIR